MENLGSLVAFLLIYAFVSMVIGWTSRKGVDVAKGRSKMINLISDISRVETHLRNLSNHYSSKVSSDGYMDAHDIRVAKAYKYCADAMKNSIDKFHNNNGYIFSDEVLSRSKEFSPLERVMLWFCETEKISEKFSDSSRIEILFKRLNGKIYIVDTKTTIIEK